MPECDPSSKPLTRPPHITYLFRFLAVESANFVVLEMDLKGCVLCQGRLWSEIRITGCGVWGYDVTEQIWAVGWLQASEAVV